MKKIINYKKYDTETARVVGSWSYGNPGDFRYQVETLYCKKTGEYFFYEKYVVDESIEPYTKEEADAWLKRHKAEIEETKKCNKK